MAVEIFHPSRLFKAPRRFKFIIIHDTSCQWENTNIFSIDKKMFQSNPMRARFRSQKQYYETPYHFICEKIGDSYQTVMGRPLQYSSFIEFPDIDRHYSENAIHVCLMGNYNILSHSAKLYEQLAYRVLCPMMKVYRIPRDRIYLHGELSNTHSDCPGFNFSKTTLYAFMVKYMMGVQGS